MERVITIGFSPCPNDTFIFDALVNQKIDTEGLKFDYFLEDVETLNQWAFEEKLDLTKLSFRALLDVLPAYKILQSGSALGNGCGPLLIAKNHVSSDDINDAYIAIPGIHTTANMLLSFAYPKATHRVPLLFSEIEKAVLNEQVDLGLIIHESRFTYQEKGLTKIIDLGAYWEEKTNCPIPLGGIAIKRDLSTDLQHKIDRLIRKSLEYSISQYPNLSSFVIENAQEMEEEVMRQHIDLYVNDYSLNLGEKGRNAILTMMDNLPARTTFRPEEMFV